MRTHTITCGCVVAGLAFAPAPRAQDLVIPAGKDVPDLRKAEGDWSFHLPSRNAPSRVLVVYRGAGLGVGRGGYKIGHVTFRRDGLKTTAYRAHRYKLDIVMSSDGVKPPSHVPDTSFDAVHGKDRTKVVSKAAVDWPALARPSLPPASWSVRVRLDKPFVLAPGRNLCVDFTSATTGAKAENRYWYVDAAAFDRTKSKGTARGLGRGCPFGFQTRARVPPLDGESCIETFAYTRVKQPSWAFLVVGISNRLWGATRLPWPIPGAPGCKLYTGPAIVLPGRTIPNDARGTVRFLSDPLPRARAFEGMRFYEQVLVSDPGSNALGVRAGSYVEVTLGKVAPPLAARLLYDSGPSLDDVPTAARDGGLVLRLEH